MVAIQTRAQRFNSLCCQIQFEVPLLFNDSPCGFRIVCYSLQRNRRHLERISNRRHRVFIGVRFVRTKILCILHKKGFSEKWIGLLPQKKCLIQIKQDLIHTTLPSQTCWNQADRKDGSHQSFKWSCLHLQQQQQLEHKQGCDLSWRSTYSEVL